MAACAAVLSAARLSGAPIGFHNLYGGPVRCAVMSRYPAARSRTVVAGVALTLGMAISCAGPVPVDSDRQSSTSAVATSFFSEPGSPWTAPVPPDAPADPRSAEYVARLSELDPAVAVRKFTVPVFVADAAAPRATIRPSVWWAPPDYALNVRLPAQAAPDPADDGHMAVLDSATNCVYEFYRALHTDDSWQAEWANAIPADSDGIYPDGLSTRASGFSSIAGLIWPEELRAGEINHALVFAYPFTREGGPVGLATRSDGRTGDPTALPIGAHLVLDPAVDIDALNLPPTERIIARALQKYGMILADSSGGFTLYAVHPASFATDPYTAVWGESTYAGIGDIPFDRMKVLTLGKQKPRYDGPPLPNRCNTAQSSPS